MSNWRGALNHGKEGEMMWEEYLKERNHTVLRSDDVRGKQLLFWDLEINDGTRFEVKYDQKAWLYYHSKEWQKSPNLFLEYWSTTRNERCGLYSSLGEADIFVYIMRHVDELGVYKGDYAYVFYIEPLIEWCEKKKFRSARCSTSGDDNAKGWLVPETAVVEDKLHNGFISRVILRQ